MKKSEMYQWLKMNKSKNFQIQMPNEIFDDLDKIEFKQWNHKAFSYSFYYLTSYIYRRFLYGENPSDYSQKKIVTSLTSNFSRVSYLTKEGGELEKIGYLKTIRDYPIQPIWVSIGFIDGKEKFIIDFLPMSKAIEENINFLQPPKNFTVKEPVKALRRYNDDEGDFTGTYYIHDNTHNVSIERFIDIVTDSSLWFEGLFLYAYLSFQCDKHKNGFVITNKNLAEIVGCSENTISKYTNRLEELKFIESNMIGFNDEKYKYVKSYKIIDGNDWRKNVI